VASARRNEEFAQRVLRAVRDQPGKTVADYAELLALSPTALYRPTRELATSGVIVKRGRQLFPA
jgi:DNA-binding Lrp family transcriptional regulator